MEQELAFLRPVPGMKLGDEGSAEAAPAPPDVDSTYIERRLRSEFKKKKKFESKFDLNKKFK